MQSLITFQYKEALIASCARRNLIVNREITHLSVMEVLVTGKMKLTVTFS